MLSFGLVEVLCKTLVRIAHDCPMQEVTDLVDQLQQFFGSIVTNAVQSPGSSSIHVLNEMLLMICFLESEECLSCGVKSECIHLLREVHRSVLDTAVETIIDMITSQQIRATTVTRIRNTTAAILSSGQNFISKIYHFIVVFKFLESFPFVYKANICLSNRKFHPYYYFKVGGISQFECHF